MPSSWFAPVRVSAPERQEDRNEQPIHRQPPEGRGRDRGLRIGEMEREPLMAQGLPNWLRERWAEEVVVNEPQLFLLQRLFANPITVASVPGYVLPPNIEVIDQTLSNDEGENTSNGDSWEVVYSGSNPLLTIYLRVPPDEWEWLVNIDPGLGIDLAFPERPELNRLPWVTNGVYDANNYLISISASLM